MRGSAMSSAVAEPKVLYAVPRSSDAWELSDETMPESMLHDDAVTLLKAILAAWVVRTGADAQVVRNLAVRWVQERPKVGVDPDVAVLTPPPPFDGIGSSVRTWLDGHAPPLLAIEVVSNSDPHKDYVQAPAKYAASGTQELWIFDPMMSGPTSHGGPFRLQLWHAQPGGTFARIYAGYGPVRSPTLGAYAVVTDYGRRLRIASDANGRDLWPTTEEAERAAKDAALAAKDAALARVAELERKLRGE